MEAARSTAPPVPPPYYGSTLIDKASVLKGNLLLAGSEEAVYRRACLI